MCWDSIACSQHHCMKTCAGMPLDFCENNWKSTCVCCFKENEHKKRQKVQKEKDETAENRERIKPKITEKRKITEIGIPACVTHTQQLVRVHLCPLMWNLFITHTHTHTHVELIFYSWNKDCIHSATLSHLHIHSRMHTRTWVHAHTHKTYNSFQTFSNNIQPACSTD